MLNTHLPETHDGLDRVLNGASAAKSAFSDIFSAKQVPTYVLGIAIMAVVTLTERALDAVNTGFAYEWAVLTVVALLTFGLLSRAVIRTTRDTQSWLKTYTANVRAKRADQKLWATANRDPRVMNDILCAQGRDDQLVDELPASKRNKSQASAMIDDGLAPLAPWAQATRYY
ncbi:MAG: hypothetical protein ABL985_07185 [Casimicrobium sp.]